MTDETERLIAVLEDDHVRPNVLESELPAFSEEAKNAAAEYLARRPEPPPPQVLARLVMIRTPQNGDAIAAAMRNGLHAPDPSTRKFAIYGLHALDVPEAPGAALVALADEADEVVTAAASVLLPRAERDPQVADALRSAYEARAGQERFHTSVSMLRAHLVEPERPA
jgi:hypothetical protein